MRRVHVGGAVVTTLCAAVALFGSALPASAQTSTRSLPIFYDAALAAKGFPNPLVKARIGGHEAVFIVDTGANTNVLADWYVKAAGIPSVNADTKARGVGGQTVSTRVVHHVEGRWSDGQRLSLNDGVVITFPPYFESLHLGGLVSPQLLAPAGTAAVLDLGVPSLRFVPFQRALSELRRSRGSTASIDPMPACRNAASKFVNRQYLVPVTMAGVSDLMLVDTGSTGTILSEDSKLAHAIKSDGERGAPTEAIGGVVNEERTVRGIELLRGGRTVAVDASVGKVTEPCDGAGRVGRLGMDALRNCSLILGENEMAFSCT